MSLQTRQHCQHCNGHASEMAHGTMCLSFHASRAVHQSWISNCGQTLMSDLARVAMLFMLGVLHAEAMVQTPKRAAITNWTESAIAQNEELQPCSSGTEA